MDQEDHFLRVGAAVFVCAVILRLAAAGFFQPVAEFLARPEVTAWIVYLETGRVIRTSPAQLVSVIAYESPEPDFDSFPQQNAEPVSFTEADAEGIEMKYSCALRPELAQLLTKPLSWDLTGREPTVLILHTHATESFTRTAGENYEESAAFRTMDEAYNMISIGERLAQKLSEGGVSVLHDRGIHDYPSYNGSYDDARKAIETYLSEYPTIRMVLDVHRDAAGDLDNQLRTRATVNGEASAQLMLVMGTDASGQLHPHWQENLSLGLKLYVVLEQKYPGICRPVSLRAQRFNQDESPGALLIEVGAAGNTHPEALIAAEALAEGILTLAKGTTENSTA